MTMICIIGIISSLLFTFIMIAETSTEKNKFLSFIMLIMAFLLFGCLTKMSYEYYQFVRAFVALASGIIGTNYLFNNKYIRGTILLVIAVIFQPYIKIHLSKGTWNIIDLITAIAFVLYAFYLVWNSNKENNNY